MDIIAIPDICASFRTLVYGASGPVRHEAKACFIQPVIDFPVIPADKRWHENAVFTAVDVRYAVLPLYVLFSTWQQIFLPVRWTNSLKSHNFFHNLFEYRCRYLGAIIDARWIIDDDEDDKLWIFQWSEADKRANILPLGIASPLCIEPLGRPRLAAEIVAGNAGILATTGRNFFRHDFTDSLAHLS